MYNLEHTRAKEKKGKAKYLMEESAGRRSWIQTNHLTVWHEFKIKVTSQRQMLQNEKGSKSGTSTTCSSVPPKERQTCTNKVTEKIT